jgi:hypothetical protein
MRRVFTIFHRFCQVPIIFPHIHHLFPACINFDADSTFPRLDAEFSRFFPGFTEFPRAGIDLSTFVAGLSTYVYLSTFVSDYPFIPCLLAPPDDPLKVRR